MLHGKAPNAYAIKCLRLRLTWRAHADDVNCVPAIYGRSGLATDTGIFGIEIVDYHADAIARDALIAAPTAKPDRSFYRRSHGSLASDGLISGIGLTLPRYKDADHPQKVRLTGEPARLTGECGRACEVSGG